MGFTLRDLVEVRDRAIRNFIATPSRCRLPGMDRDLTAEEIRVMAFVDAAIVTVFSNAGVPVSAEIVAHLPSTFTASQEPIEGYDSVPTV